MFILEALIALWRFKRSAGYKSSFGWAVIIVISGSFADTCFANSNSDFTFTPLGFLLPGATTSYSEVTGLNSPGTVAVGINYAGVGTNGNINYEAFEWTATTGMFGLGFLSGVGALNASSTVNAVSLNGNVVVGQGKYGNPLNYTAVEAISWTPSNGIIGLGFLGGGGTLPVSFASAVSSDGQIIVGTSTNASNYSEAFRWTAATGMVGLGYLSEAAAVPQSDARGMTPDGSVIVGAGTTAGGVNQPFRWTQSGGMVALGSLGSGPGTGGAAIAVSADGAVVVGGSYASQNIYEAFRWTQATGMVGLGFLPGGNGFSNALAVNVNGSVIVGQDNNVAFRWTAQTGIQPILPMLTLAGVNLSGWQFNIAQALSNDGTVIGGSGLNPSGNTEAWIVSVPVSAFAFLDLAGQNHSLDSLIGGGTVTNSGPGAATLTVGADGTNTTFAGLIEDGASAVALTKIGSGDTVVTGPTESYTGPTTILAGALVVDSSIASSSSLTIASGATLGGSGIVPGFVVPSGGTVAPGALTPFSTLHVAGSLGFLSGSTYAVDIDASGANDKIVATGAAKLSGGTVSVAAAGGNYTSGIRYTILTAGGGVSGAFSALTTSSNLAFLSPQLSYDADDVYLGFAQMASFPTVGVTSNQRATAGAVQEAGAGTLYDSVIGQSIAGARQAFDSLSGEIHASAVSAAFDDTRLPREAVLDRLSSTYGTLSAGGASGFATMNAIAAPSLSPGVFASWGQTFGSFGHISGDSSAATLDRSMGGFILGLDATFDRHNRLGVAAGYTQSTLSLAARGSNGQLDSAYGGLYGGTSLNALQVSGGAFYAFNHYGINRSVAFPDFTDADDAGYGGDTLQAYGEVGWRLPLSALAGPTFVEPIAGSTLMHIETSGFTERGGAAALTSASQSYGYASTTLGVRAETTFFSSVPLLARGTIGWDHVLGDVRPSSILAFASAPSIPFDVVGAAVARDSLVIEAGFDWTLTSNATFGVFYSGDLGSRNVENAIKGKLDAAF